VARIHALAPNLFCVIGRQGQADVFRRAGEVSRQSSDRNPAPLLFAIVQPMVSAKRRGNPHMLLALGKMTMAHELAR